MWIVVSPICAGQQTYPLLSSTKNHLYSLTDQSSAQWFKPLVFIVKGQSTDTPKIQWFNFQFFRQPPVSY